MGERMVGMVKCRPTHRQNSNPDDNTVFFSFQNSRALTRPGCGDKERGKKKRLSRRRLFCRRGFLLISRKGYTEQQEWVWSLSSTLGREVCLFLRGWGGGAEEWGDYAKGDKGR